MIFKNAVMQKIIKNRLYLAFAIKIFILCAFTVLFYSYSYGLSNAARDPIFLTDYKTNFLSDSLKVNFYFNRAPEIKAVKSNNRLEFIIDFDNCDFLNKTFREEIKDELINSVTIFKSERGVRIVVRQLQMTQTRILKGYDKKKKNFYVSAVFYRPYERYSKYEARLAEIAELKKTSVPVVLIDAGHGGKDPGAKSAFNDLEKNLNLKFAREIVDQINRSGLCRAYLTRSGDWFLSLGRRVFMANQYGADAFISIHFNANRSKKIRGFEIYYLTSGTASDKAAEILANIENSAEFLDDAITGEEDFQVQSILLDLKEKENIKESAILSELITRQASKIGRYPVSEPKQANFAVLRNLNMPSILIEIGYLSNSSDLSFLREGENFAKICSQTALGITNFLCQTDVSAIFFKNNPKTKKTASEEIENKIDDIIAKKIETDEKKVKKTNPPSNNNSKEYKVKKGDTLSKIAKKFKVSLGELKLVNNKKSHDAIFPGEVLKIPNAR